MDIDTIISICRELPSATEDIKWGDDLCFLIGGKMFCIMVLNGPLKVSFKVTDDEFDEISSLSGIIPAPYAARHKWVLVENPGAFTKKQWVSYITQSYDLIKAKLSKKKQAGLDKNKQ